MADIETTAKVDSLLFRQGEYQPLELLLAEGRLLYEDYEQWRAGGIDYLEDCLFGDGDNIRRLLADAAAYARSLKLVAHVMDYRGWGGGNVLTFSTDKPFDALFRTGYRKDQSLPQLDLFMDNIGNNLANDVLNALSNRDPAQARADIEQLMRNDPLHPKIEPLLLLIEAAESNPPLHKGELERLDREIAPLARDLLGRSANDYLIPLWRRIAESLEQNPIGTDDPQHHASNYWALAGNADMALDAVETLPDWRNRPELLIRHAAAQAKLRQQTEALLDLFRLCWAFPDHIDAAIRQMDGLYQHPWSRFRDDDCDLDARDFPAWLLIHYPRQAEPLSPEALIPLDPAPGFLTLLQLVRTERQHLCPPCRSKLKAEHPALLNCYIQRR